MMNYYNYAGFLSVYNKNICRNVLMVYVITVEEGASFAEIRAAHYSNDGKVRMSDLLNIKQNLPNSPFYEELKYSLLDSLNEYVGEASARNIEDLEKDMDWSVAKVKHRITPNKEEDV